MFLDNRQVHQELTKPISFNCICIKRVSSPSILDFIKIIYLHDLHETAAPMSVFFAPAIYMVVKIMCSSSEVVL
jgi:hypothetical protein